MKSKRGIIALLGVIFLAGAAIRCRVPQMRLGAILDGDADITLTAFEVMGQRRHVTCHNKEVAEYFAELLRDSKESTANHEGHPPEGLPIVTYTVKFHMSGGYHMSLRSYWTSQFITFTDYPDSLYQKGWPNRVVLLTDPPEQFNRIIEFLMDESNVGKELIIDASGEITVVPFAYE